MRPLALLAAVTLVATACVDLPSERFHPSNFIGTRIDLQPGAEVEIPVRLDAPGRGNAALSIDTSVVSHEPVPATAPVVRFHPVAGELEVDAANPMRVRCVGNCRGEHLLMFSLPLEAAAPVTIDWSLLARVASDGSWHSDQIDLEAQPPAQRVSDWSVILDSQEALLPTRGSVVRLHLTGPATPMGLLRMEVAATAPPREAAPVLVADGSDVRTVAWGSSIPLPVPRGCGSEPCDWSVVVAGVGSWRVAATSNEFNVSISRLDGGVLTGQATWRETVPVDGMVELQVEVTGPPGQMTSLGLETRIIIWSIRPGEQSREPVVVRIGDEKSQHDQRVSQAPMALIPMTCDADACRGSIRVVIDATSWREGPDFELWVRAGAAAVSPTSGELEVEVHP